MKTMQELTAAVPNAAQTGTKAKSELEAGSMQTWQSWLKFQTFNDPQLELMLREVVLFAQDIRTGKKPRWLTLCGNPGTGKTYLANGLKKWAMKKRVFESGYDPGIDDIRYGVAFVHWPKLAGELQLGSGSEWLAQLTQSRFLILDDIGAARDTTGFITDKLGSLLSQRTDMWTAITTNYSMKMMEERFDQRIASRMIRDGSKVIEVNTIDYALRKL